MPFGCKAKLAINKIFTDAQRRGGRRVPNEEKGYREEMNQLLDVVAIAGCVAANPSPAARVAPATGSVLNSNGLFRSQREKGSTDRFITMNADEMTTQIVLPTERTTTRSLRANVRLQTIRIMSSHMCLQVICPSKSSWTSRAAIFLSGVTFEFLKLGSNWSNCLKLSRDMQGRNRSMS
jgi:hypothetical protein